MTTPPAPTPVSSIVAALIVLVLLTIVIPFSSRTKTEKIKRKPLTLLTESELALLSKDKNKNNTEDWKDLILETMSSSTKSAAAKVVVDEKTLARLQDPNNLTASFSKNIYTASAFVSKNKNLSEEEQAKLVKDILKKESSKVTTKVYTIEDINVTATDTETERKFYGNKMAQLLNKANTYKLGASDLSALSSFNESKDPKSLEIFSTKKEHALEILNDLLSLSVPRSAALYHLALINNLSVFVATLDAFANTESDPLKSVAFFNSYIDTITSLYSSLSAVQDYFVLEAVPFKSGDPGYIFINRK